MAHIVLARFLALIEQRFIAVRQAKNGALSRGARDLRC
jgi:hypothetical protein